MLKGDLSESLADAGRWGCGCSSSSRQTAHLSFPSSSFSLSLSPSPLSLFFFLPMFRLSLSLNTNLFNSISTGWMMQVIRNRSPSPSRRTDGRRAPCQNFCSSLPPPAAVLELLLSLLAKNSARRPIGNGTRAHKELAQAKRRTRRRGEPIDS